MAFEAQWRRPPTPEEFQAMVENNVREEVLYREALAMGLDKDDTIVKRRMAQKMQFLAEDVAAAYQPTTAELQAWYEKNSDKFKYSPLLEEAFHRRKRPVWVSWRMDETYIKVKGQWYYLYRAVDKTGQTIDFLLTEQRDEQAAKRFLTKAIRRHGVPEKITIDGGAANEAAIKSYNEEHGTAIAIRKVKYLNNIVEQDHRGVKRLTRPMLGFKAFDAAQPTLVGIELMHMIKKQQLMVEEGNEGRTAAEQFYALAA
jgi:transposase-like protein